MALTNVDLKRIGKIVDESIEKKVGKIVDDKIFQALDQMILPELMKLENKIDGVEERLANRIDKVGVMVTEVKTNHERRIRKLEDEIGVVPEARLTF